MGSFCCPEKIEYTGSVFYRRIDTKLEKTGKTELDEVFDKADDPLVQSERTREKIAAAFKEMTINTGTVVLKLPDLEQSIRAYIIRFLIEIRLSPLLTLTINKRDEVENVMSKLELHKLFIISDNSPYISFDEEVLKNLKLSFNIKPDGGELGKMKEVIVTFIRSLKEIKKVYKEFLKEMEEIQAEAYEFLTKLKITDGPQELYKDLLIGKRNLQKIIDMTTIIQIISEVSRELTEVVDVFSKVRSDVDEFKKLDDLAKKMFIFKITDMKQIVWNTSNEPRLKRFESWVHNFDYKIEEQVDTL